MYSAWSRAWHKVKEEGLIRSHNVMAYYRRNYQKPVFLFWVCVRGGVPPTNSHSGWYWYVGPKSSQNDRSGGTGSPYLAQLLTGRRERRNHPGQRLCVLGARDAVETLQRLER